MRVVPLFFLNACEYLVFCHLHYLFATKQFQLVSMRSANTNAYQCTSMHTNAHQCTPMHQTEMSEFGREKVHNGQKTNNNRQQTTVTNKQTNKQTNKETYKHKQDNNNQRQPSQLALLLPQESMNLKKPAHRPQKAHQFSVFFDLH